MSFWSTGEFHQLLIISLRVEDFQSWAFIWMWTLSYFWTLILDFFQNPFQPIPRCSKERLKSPLNWKFAFERCEFPTLPSTAWLVYFTETMSTVWFITVELRMKATCTWFQFIVECNFKANKIRWAPKQSTKNWNWSFQLDAPIFFFLKWHGAE